MNDIFLFDFEYVLCEPGQILSSNHRQILKQFLKHKKGQTMLVSDFDRQTIEHALGKEIFKLFDVVITSNGNVVYGTGEKLYDTGWEVNDLHSTWIHDRANANKNYTLRHGRMLEKRHGCGIFSVIGFEAPQPEKERFATIDRRTKTRQQICDDFNKRFANARAKLFGSTEILISSNSTVLEKQLAKLSSIPETCVHYYMNAHNTLSARVLEQLQRHAAKLFVHRIDSQQTLNKSLKTSIQSEKLFA